MFLWKGVEGSQADVDADAWTVILRYNDPLLIYFGLSIYKNKFKKKF